MLLEAAALAVLGAIFAVTLFSVMQTFMVVTVLWAGVSGVNFLLGMMTLMKMGG